MSIIAEPKLRRIDGYVVDCITEETPRRSTEITEHPVESGATLSDHARVAPMRVDLVAVVTDTPIGEVAKERTPGVIHTSEARAFFRRLQDERRPFTFEGVTGVYTDMMIEELSEPTDSSTGASITLELTIRRVDIRSVRRLTVRAPHLGHRASRDVNINRPLWYCPDLVVSNRYANNVGKGCRRVRHVQGRGWIFDDTGEPLSAAQLAELASQRQEVEAIADGRTYVTRTESGRYARVLEQIDPRTGKITAKGRAIAPGSPAALELDKAFASEDATVNRARDLAQRAQERLAPDDDLASGTTGKWY